MPPSAATSRAAASATAVVSLPPRPSVVMSPLGEIPWNPQTTGTAPESRMRCSCLRSICEMRALRCAASVSMPACAPVRLTASQPSVCSAMAMSATEICSPVAINMSISRGLGAPEICSARPISWSVVWPMALTTTTTRLPALRASTMRAAQRMIRCGSATLVPPNFWTIVGILPALIPWEPAAHCRGPLVTLVDPSTHITD